MITKRKIIKIDGVLCNGCGQCVTACAEGAIEIVDGKARVTSDSFCDGLGACIGHCPQGALRIVEREAASFNAHAAVEHAREKDREHDGVRLSLQCPSARLRQLRTAQKGKDGGRHCPSTTERSTLMNWPVKLKLVPADAMFLKTARLLVVSDCVAFAYPTLHRDFMTDRVVLTGCPKFDDTNWYIQKCADIFKRNTIQSITVIVMEVPCCQAMPRIVERGMRSAGLSIPLKTVIIGIEGEVLKTVSGEW